MALVVVGLLILSQAPFAYRRYRLGRLRSAIDSLNAARAAPPEADPYVDYKGVFHVHSFLGGHSEGTFEEIVQAARANGLAFVVMTEHPSRHVDTAEATLKGAHDGVLFLNGSELSAANGERVFALPGAAPSDAPDARSIAARVRGEGRLAFAAYPEEIRDWGSARDYDGIEVYNLYTDSKNSSYVRLFFDGLWSYRGHADLLFTNIYDRPEANLRRWDELNSAGGKLTAVAGNDAHSNVGLDFGDRAGNSFFEIKLDPYERSFRLVRNHVLLESGQTLDAPALLSALRQGRSYIAFDIFGDSGGFRFSAETGVERKTMGEEITLPAGGEVRLKITTPVRSRVVVLKNGQPVREVREITGEEISVGEKGAYRVEVYLDALRDFIGDKPWIISNPIYVR